MANQRRSRVLDDADAVAVVLQELVDAIPSAAIDKAAVNENNANRIGRSHEDLPFFG
jgi:hypothetical protein